MQLEKQQRLLSSVCTGSSAPFHCSSTLAHPLAHLQQLSSLAKKKVLLLAAHYNNSLNCLPQLTDIHTINHSLAPLQQLTGLAETIQKLHELSIYPPTDEMQEHCLRFQQCKASPGRLHWDDQLPPATQGCQSTWDLSGLNTCATSLFGQPSTFISILTDNDYNIAPRNCSPLKS